MNLGFINEVLPILKVMQVEYTAYIYRASFSRV